MQRAIRVITGVRKVEASTHPKKLRLFHLFAKKPIGNAMTNDITKDTIN
jgi:hypothetical protein